MKKQLAINEKIVAPIEQGQVHGTVTYSVDGLEYSAKLLAEKDVELKTYYVEIGIGAGIFIVVVLIFAGLKKKSRRSRNR